MLRSLPYGESSETLEVGPTLKRGKTEMIALRYPWSLFLSPVHNAIGKDIPTCFHCQDIGPSTWTI